MAAALSLAAFKGRLFGHCRNPSRWFSGPTSSDASSNPTSFCLAGAEANTYTRFNVPKTEPTDRCYERSTLGLRSFLGDAVQRARRSHTDRHSHRHPKCYGLCHRHSHADRHSHTVDETW